MPVYIQEYARQPIDRNNRLLPAGEEPAVTSQTVAVGASSTQSSPFNTLTGFVRVHTDVVCSVAFGANPTATATSMRMAANTTEFFGVTPGHRVAVIQNT